MSSLNEYLNDQLFIQCIEHAADTYRLTDLATSDAAVSKTHTHVHRTLRVTIIGTGDVCETILQPHETVEMWVERFAETLDTCRPNNPHLVKHVIQGIIHHHTLSDGIVRTRHEHPVNRDDLRAHPLYNPDRHVVRTIPVAYQHLHGVVHATHTPHQSPDEITAIVDTLTSVQIDTILERRCRKP